MDKLFVVDNFLLGNVTAKVLFNQYVLGLAFVNYHNQDNPFLFAENVHFNNEVSKLWFGGVFLRYCVQWRGEIPGNSIPHIFPDKKMNWTNRFHETVRNPIFHGYIRSWNGFSRLKVCWRKMFDVAFVSDWIICVWCCALFERKWSLN